MTVINPGVPAAIIRGATAETLGSPDYPAAVCLLADASATGGALSAQRVTLRDGAEGARPHRHSGSILPRYHCH